MGNTDCCEGSLNNVISNELTTEKKKQNRVVTDADELNDINKFKSSNLKEEKENLFNAIGDINGKIDNIKDKYNYASLNINNSKIYNPNDSKIKQNLLEKIDEKKETKNLNLEIISSSFEPQGLLLKITPLGYEKSLRGIKDGITYFGYEEENMIKGGKPTIDYIIRPKEEVLDDRFIGKHFQIKYNIENNLYTLKDLGHGFGTFIKILQKIEIKNNFLVSLGENYIVFTLGVDDEYLLNEKVDKNLENQNIITIKIFSGNIRHGKLSFQPKQSPFIIGRSPDCEVIIDDNMLSRFHCTVQYDEVSQKWFLWDGVIERKSKHNKKETDLNNNEKKNEKNETEEINNKLGNTSFISVKNSTNGTWVYAFEDTTIYEGMTFKANHNLFICSFSD